jgi:hypothetical protein
MSRKLAVVFLAMLVLVGAMSLKTAVVAHSDGTVILANGGAPAPPVPWMKNGGAPAPPVPWKNGGAPAPPVPWKNGGAPAPPVPWN